MKKLSQVLRERLNQRAKKEEALLSILNAEEHLLSTIQTHSETFQNEHDLALLREELTESIDTLNSELKKNEIHTKGSR